MQWKKDANLKYTDMCIYIDENIPNIVGGKHPEIENTVYNYLWLLVKALAIKKRMFQNFSDYDGYAFYSASRLYFALKKNYLNQGKTIKGKLIRPIKSCLNYTKALLYPMKIEYQREAFNEILSEEAVSKKFDAFNYKQKLKEAALGEQSLNTQISFYIQDVIKNLDTILDRVLVKSPFTPGSLDYKKLKITVLLNCIQDIKTKKNLGTELSIFYLWKLPKSLSDYVRILIKEFYTQLKVEIMDCYHITTLDDSILEKLISTPSGEFKDYED